jgi:hypothetical protein
MVAAVAIHMKNNVANGDIAAPELSATANAVKVTFGEERTEQDQQVDGESGRGED